MRISERWLREWIDTPSSRNEIAHKLTMAGIEVNPPEPVASPLNNVVVGKVLNTLRHPNADKLTLCQVSLGQTKEPLSVVCGAPNVQAGMTVPLALPGARLANGQKIKKSKIRGETSDGMLCSASELGMEEQSAGILELPSNAPLGLDIQTYLQLDDFVFEFDLTPNRGDCLSVLGIARELAAIEGLPFVSASIPNVPEQHSSKISITLSEPERCSRYVGRIIRGINPLAETPIWMRERLRRSGLRSLGPLIDITNYVMLEMGQPMHAFDLDKISGDIQIRSAREKETLTLLNGRRVILDKDSLVIANQSGPIALAGIMGGEQSAVSKGTRSILLESAWFPPQAITGRARKLGITSDASQRFERGVDPRIQKLAIERATVLILEISGGSAGPVIDEVDNLHQKNNKSIQVDPKKINGYLGTDIQNTEIQCLLESLGMAVEIALDECWIIGIPSYRFDLQAEEDLVEEVARLYGYHRISPALPEKTVRMLPHRDTHIPTRRLTDILTSRGYYEVITYSFIDRDLQQKIDPHLPPLSLSNPLSAGMSVMRTSLWPGLLQTIRYNQHRQQRRVRVFETGAKFLQSDDQVLQDIVLSGIIVGSANPPHWDLDSRPVDYFDLKADVESLLQAGLHGQTFSFKAERHPALHPGRSACLYKGGVPVGWLGSLHPDIVRDLDLDDTPQVFEIELGALHQGKLPRHEEVSRFPSIRRDLAVILDKRVSVAELLNHSKIAAGEMLQDLWLFDQYQGSGMAEHERSLGLALLLGARDRTLTDVEVGVVMEKVISDLAAQIGARLRGS